MIKKVQVRVADPGYINRIDINTNTDTAQKKPGPDSILEWIQILIRPHWLFFFFFKSVSDPIRILIRNSDDYATPKIKTVR